MDNYDKLVSDTGIELSAEQKDVIQHNGGSCIIACAGSGKTTTLVNLIAYKVLNKEIDIYHTLCTTYSKSGSQEMEDRLNSVLKKIGCNTKMYVHTMHSIYKRTLEAFGLRGEIINEGQRKMMLTNSLKALNRIISEDDRDAIGNLLSYQVNNLMNDEQVYKSSAFSIDCISLEEYTQIRQSYNEQKKSGGYIDFDDLQLYMYVYLVVNKNTAMREYVRGQYNYFIVDEFQDTSRIQFEILKALVDKPEELVVVGDDDQCIYEWRGADPSIILNIYAYFNIKKFILPTNYRCRKKILDVAKTGIEYMSVRESKDMKSVKDGGYFKLIESDSRSLVDISNKVVDTIKEELRQGTKAEDICVMCRNNVHAPIIANMLLANSIYSDYNEAMKIGNQAVYKDIQDIMKIAEVDTVCDIKIMRRILWKIVPYLSKQIMNVIEQLMRATGMSLCESISYILGTCDSYYRRRVTVKDVVISEAHSMQINANYSNLKTATREGLYNVVTVLEKADIVDRINWLMSLYVTKMEESTDNVDTIRNIRGYTGYINQLFTKFGYIKTMDLLRANRQYDEDGYLIACSKVQFSTMHSSKGKEWKTVIIVGDDNVSMPSFSDISRMKDRVSPQDICKYIDGERRLHYVAYTRAIDKLYVVTSSSNPGMFLCECLGLVDNLGGNANNERILGYARYGIDKELVDKMKDYMKGDIDIADRDE